MTPEEKALLQRTFELAQENNKILHKIRRSAVLTSIFQVFYWLLIIGLTFGAFYFIQPYLNSITSAYSSLGLENTGSEVSSGSLQDILNNLKSLTK